MNDNKQNSFETVDLLSPVEMLPIQDIGSPLEETEIKKESFPTLPDVSKEATQNSAVDNYNAVAISQDTGDREYESNDHIDVYPENNTFYNNSNNKILSPEEIFHRENAERRRFDENNNRKRSVMLVSFAAFMIGMLFIVRMIVTRGIERSNAGDNNREMPGKTIENSSDLPINDLIMQDEVYGILNVDSLNEFDSAYVSINPEIIEYTGIYERCLYFRVTPKDENVSVAISVEMIDSYGKSMGTVVGAAMGIPKGREGMIPVSFGISPSLDLNNITYNISVESRKSSGKILKRDISDIKVENGIIYVSVSGDKNIDKYAYMVYYKNNKVVKVDWQAMYIDGAETVVLEFDTNDISFDSSQIYY